MANTNLVKCCLLVDQNNIKLVNFHISSPLHSSKIPISNAWLVENLDLPRFKINKNTIKNEWKHLQDLLIEVDISKEISILIGADFHFLHLSYNVRIGKEMRQEMRHKRWDIAILTPLGWVLMGGEGNGDCINTKKIIYQKRWSNLGPWKVMEWSLRTVFH